MRQNEEHLYEGSGWVLYQGTTTYRLRSILKDGRLSRQGIGEQKISLTRERSVAEYWACVSTSADRSSRNRIPQGQDAVPTILVLDGEKLLALGYKLVPFSDTYHGQGNAIGKTRSRVGTGLLSTWMKCSSRWSRDMRRRMAAGR